LAWIIRKTTELKKIIKTTMKQLIGNNCANQLDTAEVIRIAKKENAWWDKKNWKRKTQYSRYPRISFDEQKCEWIVYSVKIRETRKGSCDYSDKPCKESGYCTVKTSVSVVIDASTKKVKSKKKTKSIRHNLIRD
jgi:hypothetical protein